MKHLIYLLVPIFALSACFMSEDEFEGTSKYNQVLIDTEIQKGRTETFGLSSTDSIANSQTLKALDGQGNLYIVNRPDLKTRVWSRFWMGDSIIRDGLLSSPLLEEPTDSILPSLVLYIDTSYFAQSFTPELQYPSQVNVNLKWFVETFDSTQIRLNSDSAEAYNLARLSDSNWNALVKDEPKDSLTMVADYIINTDTIISVDSVYTVQDTLTDGDTTIVTPRSVTTYDTTYQLRHKLRIDLDGFALWDQIFVENSQDAKYHFVNFGVSILDPIEMTPIRFKSEDDFTYKPRLAFLWSTDSILDYYLGDKNQRIDTTEYLVEEYKQVERWAIRAAYEVESFDREDQLKLFSNIGDTLELSIAWDKILDLMEIEREASGIQDDKVIVWAKLNVPIPANGLSSTFDLGARYYAIINLAALDNTPEFVNYGEHQFEDSSFTPEAIIWESTSPDTLSLYISELARRAVNRELNEDSLKLKIVPAYTYLDSTSNSTKSNDSIVKFHSFDVLNLGPQADLELNVDVGWIDLEEAP